MQPPNKKERHKRSQNRMRIGYFLLGLSVVLTIVAYFITHHIILFFGFLVPVGLVYLFAGLWEKQQLNK